MKVFHVVTHLNFGGVEQHLATLSKNINHSRFNHEFIAIGKGGSVEKQMRQIGADVTVLHKKVTILSIEAVRRLYKLFIQEEPSVVHTHGAEANFHGIIAARLAGVPVRIGEEIGIPSHSKIAKVVFRFIYTFSSAVVGISSQVVDWLVENREVPREKTFRSYLPVEEEGISQKEEQDSNAFTLLTVSRLHPVKNISLVINAVSELIKDDENIELLIVGDGPEKENLQQLAKREGIEGVVQLTGYESNPWKYATRADLYLLPSFSEGLGISLVEAMMCKLPCIATNVGGANELIIHGENGWLIDPYDKKSLIHLIKEIKDMPAEERKAIAVRGAEIAAKKCHPKNYMERLDNIYLELLERKNIAKD